MFRSVYVLCGDSDADGTLCARLRDCRPGLFDEWIDVPLAPDIDSRLAQLDALVPHGEAARQIVLLGRSAGARVVSIFATRRTVGAVVCLSYPFRMPNRRLEPARFAHLAELAVPTLIVQGCRDEYGGLDITEHYAFSPSVSSPLHRRRSRADAVAGPPRTRGAVDPILLRSRLERPGLSAGPLRRDLLSAHPFTRREGDRIRPIPVGRAALRRDRTARVPRLPPAAGAGLRPR